MTALPRIMAPPTPDEAPLDMPTQDLSAAPKAGRFRQSTSVYLARVTAFGGAAALTVYGSIQMTLVFGNETSTLLQSVLLIFFTITFGWIALSATQAVAALFVPHRKEQRTDQQPLTTRTVIIMPVYNENPAMTCASLHAMGKCIADAGAARAFEIFILSDTTDPAVWTQEVACFDTLRRALKHDMPVWYRRRYLNTGRKAGNLREFVERWGGRYDYMLVLDADSLMSAHTVVTLARRMQAEPKLGILQTVPVLMGGATVFARIQQFAGRVYGPIIARGVAAWQGLDGNYWGHNAIIRMRAFAACCGMPELPGRMPFGGHVLSHDFVEAALIRKGGYQVRMDTDLEGSWEGSPQSLLDLAARDRRWAQGNLQHAKIVGARGLSWSNRAHFLIGIGSYVMSSIWLAMLVTGGFLTVQSLIYGREYFENRLQLFPQWPVFDSERMTWLFVLSMTLLFLPKIAGTVRAIWVKPVRHGFGGARRILSGAVFEIALSALLAPILMFFQVQQLIEILRGRDSGWSAQSRDVGDMSWKQAFASHWAQVVIGLIALGLVVVFAPAQLVWLTPVLLGLLLAPLVSRFTSRIVNLAIFDVLSIPEDTAPPRVATLSNVLRSAYDDAAQVTPEQLLKDGTMNRRHIASLASFPNCIDAETSVDLDEVTARAKLDAAQEADQGLAWLSKKELLKLLSSPELLSRYCDKFS
ncbi:MAG: glucans biosynthesis glucosyltransferase MdoH [Roseobacter sp.]